MVVNHRRSCRYGAHLMSELALPELEWATQTFPILINRKLKDQDVFVHSLGCSVWNTFGHENGLMAIVECPAPGTHGADIRSDSGWFCLDGNKPICLIEFERYDGSDRAQLKLEEKLRNLLEAAQRWEGSPKTVVLSVWSQGVVRAPDTQRLQEYCRYGFISSAGSAVSCPSDLKVVVSRFLFINQSTVLTLDRIHHEVLV